MLQEFGSNMTGRFPLKFCHEVAVSSQPGLPSPKGVTGAGGSSSQVGHCCGWQASAGCWPEAWVPSTWISPQGHWLSSSGVSDSRQSKAEATSFTAWSQKPHVVITALSYWLHSLALFRVRGDHTRVLTSRRTGSSGAILRAGCHSYNHSPQSVPYKQMVQPWE